MAQTQPLRDVLRGPARLRSLLDDLTQLRSAGQRPGPGTLGRLAGLLVGPGGQIPSSTTTGRDLPPDRRGGTSHPPPDRPRGLLEFDPDQDLLPLHDIEPCSRHTRRQ
jgi:hypothetical protein